MSSFAQLGFLRKTIRRLRDVVDVERTAVFLENTGIYWFHLLTGFRVRTYMWFHCTDILILWEFCIRVVATCACFGSFSRYVMLFQSANFEYVVFYDCVSPFYVGGERYFEGLFRVSAKRICVRRESIWGLRAKVSGKFENFNVLPRWFCQVWLNA